MSVLFSLVVLATSSPWRAWWLAHKYLMHGAMWYFHEDHHSNGPGFFEKNDAFLIFAVPSAYCFISGSIAGDFRF